MNPMDSFNAEQNNALNYKIETEQDMLDYIVITIIQNLGQENLAFKGGYMLNQLVPEVSRQTRDVDLSVDSQEEYEKVKLILKDIAEHFVSLGLAKEYSIKDTITPTSSGGLTLYDANGSRFLGVDVGWHQLITGTKWYNLKLGQVHAFSVERMLSDKVHAIFTRKRFRRTKDLYDVYILLENFDVDYEKFKECVDARGLIDWNASPFREEVLVQYSHAWNKLEVRNAITSEIIKKSEFNLVISRLSDFVTALTGNRGSDIYWDKKEVNWCANREKSI